MLSQAGGQLSELYPKNLFMISFPEVLAGDLVDNLMEQIKQFEPGFTLGERAETIENKKMERLLTSNKGKKFHAPVIATSWWIG
jgi:thioredoxin reductase (NADPH)